jgi:hypothetical protein
MRNELGNNAITTNRQFASYFDSVFLRESFGRHYKILIIAELSALAIFTFLTIIAPFVLDRLWNDFKHLIANYKWIRYLIVLLLMAAAGMFYVLKKRHQALYGAAEIFGGAVICWLGLSSRQPRGAAVGIALASGIYIFVRGIDNFVEGMKKRARE